MRPMLLREERAVNPCVWTPRRVLKGERASAAAFQGYGCRLQMLRRVVLLRAMLIRA
jgi:hypothetical protein